MKIEVLGPGCKNCETTASRFAEIIEELGIEAELNHITDMNEVMERGIALTPAVIIDDEIVVSGEVPSRDKIKELLQQSS